MGRTHPKREFPVLKHKNIKNISQFFYCDLFPGLRFSLLIISQLKIKYKGGLNETQIKINPESSQAFSCHTFPRFHDRMWGGGGGAGGVSNSGPAPTPALYSYGISSGSTTNSPGSVGVVGIDSAGVGISSQFYSGVTTSEPVAEASATVGGKSFLYVVIQNSNVVDEFAVNGLNVTKLGSVATGVGPVSIYVDPSRNLVFVGDSNNTTAGGGDIYSYTINSNGTLSPVGTPAFSNVDPVYAVQEDTTGTYLIAGCEIGNPVSGWVAKSFMVNTDGTLTYVASSGSGAGIVPAYFAVVPNTTNGDILYGAVQFPYNNSPYFYTVVVTSSTVTLTSTPKTSGNYYSPAWIDPTGTWLFEATYNPSTNSEVLTQYKIGASGSLTLGPEGSLTVANGNNGFIGGVTNSVSGYISTSGTVIFPLGYALLYNAMNGSLSNPKVLSLNGADGTDVFLP